MLILTATLVIFLITHKKKQYRNLLEKQQMESNYQNQLLQSKLEVQEQSFKHFSEEIHDNVGQMLSIVKMQLYGIKNSSKEQEVVTKAADCTELLGKAINDLRNISHTLNSAFVSNAGLADTIEKDLEYIRSARDVKCTLHRSGQEYELENEKELMVFRIIQEAVGNAVKHASASTIDVYLHYQPDKLNVVIADDGKGFDTGAISKSGIGLNNMHVRADLLKGNLQLVSEKDKGTTITFSIDNTETILPIKTIDS